MKAKIPIQCTEEQLDTIVASIIASYKKDYIVKLFEADFTQCYDDGEYALALKSCFERTDPPRWRAEEGNSYYFVDSCGKADYDVEHFYSPENERYELGNYFHTREETKAAEAAAKEAEAYAEKVREVFKGNL